MILILEEPIYTEWVYMWDKFGGYLLPLLGLTAKAERVQDEVRLRLFLDSIGFSDLTAKKIKKWLPEDRGQFEIIQESCPLLHCYCYTCLCCCCCSYICKCCWFCSYICLCCCQT